MATPISAGATALLLEHLIDNLGVAEPTSALVKAILASSTHDMAGQFGSPTIGAGEAACQILMKAMEESIYSLR